jgi:hypothetical protein
VCGKIVNEWNRVVDRVFQHHEASMA